MSADFSGVEHASILDAQVRELGLWPWVGAHLRLVVIVHKAHDRLIDNT